MAEDEKKPLELKYRPLELSEIIGWEKEKESLQSMMKTKQTFLLYGPRGCGKTTTARIICYDLEVDDLDIHEIDGASNNGVEQARRIKEEAGLAPLKGKRKAYIIDECHRLTGNAEDALLKTIEEPPAGCIFILCSSEVSKISKTIRSRCAGYEVKPLDPEQSKRLLDWICKEEGLTISKDVLNAIISNCEGIPREMVIALDMVKDMKKDQDAIDLVSNAGGKKEVIDLCWALLDGKPWGEICTILKSITEEPENVRYAVLGVMNTMLLKDDRKQKQAALIIDCFKDSFIYTRKAGLTLACYMTLNS